VKATREHHGQTEKGQNFASTGSLASEDRSAGTLAGSGGHNAAFGEPMRRMRHPQRLSSVICPGPGQGLVQCALRVWVGRQMRQLAMPITTTDAWGGLLSSAAIEWQFGVSACPATRSAQPRWPGERLGGEASSNFL